MRRRDFVRSGVALAGGLVLPLGRFRPPSRRDAWFLVPMDDAQGDHLKAYGLAFRALERGEKGEWFLNYRGGSFMLPASDVVKRDAALAGVTLESADDGAIAMIKGQIQASNMDAIPLEKAPRVAVYSPPGAQPWDDAVTMALEYAGIKYDRIWDFEVIGDQLNEL